MWNPDDECVTLTTINYMCDGEECKNIYIPPSEGRFVCVTCSPIDNTFDLCEDCVRDHDASHTLIVVKPSPSSPESEIGGALTLYPSLAESLANRFANYRGLKFIGTLKTNPQFLSEETNDIPQNADAYDYVTYDHVYVAARSLATNLLLQTSLKRGGSVGIVGETNLCAQEWITVDMACVFADLISIPLPTDFTTESIQSILCDDDNRVPIVFCTPAQAKKIRCALSMPHDEEEQTKQTKYPKLVIFGSDEWTNLASSVPEHEWSPLPKARKPSDVRTLFFTSGSTGKPKGTIITDAMLNNELAKIAPMGLRSDFVFRPLSYSTQRLYNYQNISSGGRLQIFSGFMDTFFEELRISQVTGFGAPPRIWSLLHAKYTSRVQQLSLQHPHTPKSHIESICQEEIYSFLGSKCRSIGTGGAITQPHLYTWMKETFEPRNIVVRESYGCTECGTIAVDGVKCHDVLVHLESIPELGYEVDQEDGCSQSGKGLLWVHNDREQSSGYFQNENQTQEHFCEFPVDARGTTKVFYNTGDIVDYNHKTKQLKVIDRVKNVLRLSSALFVSPEHLEGIYSECELVESVFVYARSDYDFVVAVVVPSSLCSLKRKEEKEGDDTEGQLKSSILAKFRALGARANVRPYEIPRAILLETKEEHPCWTVDNGLMISNFKLNRLALTARYKDDLHMLYQSVRDGGGSTKKQKTSSGNDLIAAGEQEKQTDGGVQELSNSFDDALCKVLQTNICPSPTLKLNEIGVDSVSAVHLQTLLSSIGRKPPLDMLLTSSLDRIKEFVLNGRGGDRQTDHGDKEDVDWEVETTLPQDILPTDDHVCAEGKVFLTGASGFLGIFILKEILDSSNETSVFAHVRANSKEEGLKRLRRNASSHFLGIDWDRVEVVCGDLSLPQLGLENFTYIASQTSLVIHCGAYVNALLPYNALRDVNVKSTLECLRFRRKLIFVSSLSAVVSSDDHSEKQYLKQTLSLRPLKHMGGYGASKRVCEILLRKATAVGCECVIVRPGTIGGSASTGSYNHNDTVPRFIRGCSYMSCAPRIDDVTIAALDVRLVACIVLRAEDGLYHARGHGGLTVSQLGDSLGVPLLPSSEWRRLLWLSGPENPLFPLKETYFLGSGFPISHDGEFSNSRAMELVKDRVDCISPHLTATTIIAWAKWLG